MAEAANIEEGGVKIFYTRANFFLFFPSLKYDNFLRSQNGIQPFQKTIRLYSSVFREKMPPFRIFNEFLMFLSPKAATLTKFALNQPLSERKQAEFSKKSYSLQIFKVKYASASVTILQSEIFFELMMKFYFSWLFLPKIKAPSHVIRAIS